MVDPRFVTVVAVMEHVQRYRGEGRSSRVPGKPRGVEHLGLSRDLKELRG
jgi:hypothetical protein